MVLNNPAPQTIERLENIQKELEACLQRVQRLGEECESILSKARFKFERKNADCVVEEKK